MTLGWESSHNCLPLVTAYLSYITGVSVDKF